MSFGPRAIGSLRRWLPLLVIVALLAMPSFAAAQGKKGKQQPEEEAERSFTLPYVITVTLIALGVVVTCMPVQRDSGNLDRDLA